MKHLPIDSNARIDLGYVGNPDELAAISLCAETGITHATHAYAVDRISVFVAVPSRMVYPSPLNMPDPWCRTLLFALPTHTFADPDRQRMDIWAKWEALWNFALAHAAYDHRLRLTMEWPSTYIARVYLDVPWDMVTQCPALRAPQLTNEGSTPARLDAFTRYPHLFECHEAS